MCCLNAIPSDLHASDGEAIYSSRSFRCQHRPSASVGALLLKVRLFIISNVVLECRVIFLRMYVIELELDGRVAMDFILHFPLSPEVYVSSDSLVADEFWNELREIFGCLVEQHQYRHSCNETDYAESRLLQIISMKKENGLKSIPYVIIPIQKKKKKR